MANKFVWDGGDNTTGLAWDTAYTSLMRDWGAEGGFTPATDFAYVRSIHTETSGTTLTITGSTAEGTTARVNVESVVGAASGTDPGNLAAGAAVNTNNTSANIIINEGIYIHGVDFFSNNDIQVGGASSVDHDPHLELSRLELIGTSAADNVRLGSGSSNVGQHIRFTNVTLDFANASQGINCAFCRFTWTQGGVDFDVATLFELPSSLGLGQCRITGVNFSTLTSSSLINGATSVNGARLFIFSRCLLATGATIVSGTIDVPGFRVESHHCQIGTDSDPAYQMEINDSRGKIEADVARYRTGGASDGERTNEYSWSLDTTVGSVRGYPGHALESPPIDAWTDGDASTAHTYRIYIASGGTLNDDDIWFELEGPNDTATDSMAVINTTRVAPRTTASAYTTDGSSTWTGADVGTKQQMDITYTPDKPGPITVRIYMAVASDRVSIDPKIVIDP